MVFLVEIFSDTPKLVKDAASLISVYLRPPPPPKKSIFVKKMKIEINAWEDSPSSALSETL